MILKSKIRILYFSLAVSLFTLVAYNLPLFSFAWEKANMSMFSRCFLLGSLALVMVALNMMLTYLLVFLTRYVGRVLIAITLIINALAEFFVLTYSIILDGSMISNVFNTRYSEASGFFSWPMVFFVLFLGVVPAVWVVWQPLNYGKKKQMGYICGGSFLFSLILIGVNIGNTLWISRYETQLGGLSMPWSYIANTFRYIGMKNAHAEEEILLPDGEITDTTKTAVVLVIGESARRANIQLYGYERQNTPLLKKQEGVSILNANSCATYTTGGVRCIVEPTDGGPLYEILPNYAARMGCDVSWRTVNWGEPPVKVDEYLDQEALQKMYPDANAGIDSILFHGLKERILSSKSNKVLVVLHTYTCHGPDYCRRIPDSFQKYTPILDNVEEARKNRQALVNAYDNSILYTDYLLSNTIDSLRSMKEWNTAMLFISDHGESLGENNLFMHGIPMNMAPKVQYEIPFIVWTSDSRKVKDDKVKAVDQHSVFHTVINLLSIKSPAYKPELDVFVNP